MTEKIELPDGALDQVHPWSGYSEEDIRDWEQHYQGWMKDWIAMTKYVQWRAGASWEGAAMLVAANSMTIGGRHLEALLGAYNDVARVQGEFSEQRAAEHEDWRAMNKAATERAERQMALQERATAALERTLPYMEREADELSEPWRDEERDEE